MMTPQLLDSPQTHISVENSRQYQQLEAETHTKMFRNAKQNKKPEFFIDKALS